MQISVYVHINNRDRCNHTTYVTNLKISGTQIYLDGDKVYVQRVTDIVSFQRGALIKTSTTTAMLMVMVTKLANGMG